MPRHARLQRHRLRSLLADERGHVSLEAAVVYPAVLTIMWLGMQGALLYQGRTTALAAAQEGARVAAAERGTVEAGIAAAQDFATTSAMALEGSVVTGTKSAAEAEIVVSLRTTSLIPGWDPTVTAHAAMPVERVS